MVLGLYILDCTGNTCLRVVKRTDTVNADLEVTCGEVAVLVCGSILVPCQEVSVSSGYLHLIFRKLGKEEIRILHGYHGICKVAFHLDRSNGTGNDRKLL